MTINRFIVLFLIIGICSCHQQATQQVVIAPQQVDAPCACPFIADKPAYKINEAPDSLTQYYLAIWKRAFIRRNDINEARFATMIKYVSGSLNSWREGVSLRVDFTYQLDWLSIHHNEQIRVLYDSVTTKSYAVNVPRGVYLTEAQLLLREPWDDVQPIQLGAKLAFSSCADACHALKTKTGFIALKPNRVSFYPQASLPDLLPGQPYLFSNGTLDSTANQCVFGQINLVTGEAKASQGPCWIQ
ncbi:hypothetical protein [Spirosoma jeollabukense]